MNRHSCPMHVERARSPVPAVLPAVLPALLLGAAFALAGCKENRSPLAPPPAPARMMASGQMMLRGSEDSARQSLAYSHALQLRVPQAELDRHYQAARSRCLEDAALHCVLLSASLRHDSASGTAAYASLEVRLPHASVGPYAAAISAPLPGEQPGDVVAVEQSTSAEDLSRPIADTGRELAQLTAYRQRLEGLAGRPSAETDDLIKIARELADVQSRIDAAQTRQRDFAERVDTERLSVSYSADVPDGGQASPLAEAWRQSGVLLAESAAQVMVFIVTALPWIPVGLLGLAVLWLLLRARRRKA